MPSKSDLIRLKHMRDAAEKALRFTSGKSRGDLSVDEQLALACIRLIEIIGEAAAKVGMETKERLSEIPWNDIVGTRNRLIHGYEEVDLDIVWQILKQDLPDLLERLDRRIKEEGDQPALWQ
jgi:uncharacterized protein with HEPN domain